MRIWLHWTLLLICVGCLGLKADPIADDHLPELGVVPMRPTSLEIKKVVEYYLKGSDPVLVDFKICRRLAKRGDRRDDCVIEAGAPRLASGEKDYLWMSLLVPRSLSSRNLVVRFSQADQVRASAREVLPSGEGAMRYVIHPSIPLLPPGSYEATVWWDDQVNLKLLDETSFDVGKS